MLKRFWAFLTALLLLAGCAQAAAPIASYMLPAGAEVLHLWDSSAWEAPEGLENLYLLMQNAVPGENVYLVRMPHGRAMVSVNSTQPPQHLTAQELLNLWPQIARTIAEEGVAVDASEHCAGIENLYGFDALSIHTTITIGTLVLDARGIAFMRGEELLEVWAVAPQAAAYAQDETACAELAVDTAAMEAFLESLHFTNLESMAVEGVPYVDPDGRFALVIPEGSTILTPHSTQQEVDSARQAYLAAHETGADKLFDEYMSDVSAQNTTVIISGDQNVVAEIYASQEEDFRDVTAEQLAALAPSIGQSLAERFDLAFLLSSEQHTMISAHRHAWLTYWLRSGEANTQLDVMAAVLDDAWLYEVDVFVHDGDQNQRTLWHTFITQTLRYTPLENALN